MAEGYWPRRHRLIGVIDSHTHLFLCEGEEDDLVAAAEEAGVRRMLNVGLGAETNPVALAAAERHDGVFATVGCHPTSAGEFDDELAAEIRKLAEHERVRAIGETGLDYYRDSASREDQRVAFDAQIEIADRIGLPIVIHARDPEGETGRDRRRLQDPRPAPDRGPGDPPLLPRPLAGRGRDRARLVLLVLGDRHLPEVRRAARGGGGPARRAASWSRPTPPTWRRSRCAASRTSPPTSSPRPRWWPQRGARPTRSWSGSSRRTGAPSLRRDGEARAELPRRPEPARRDRPRRRARPGRRRPRGRGRGGGADRAAGRGGRPRPRDRARSRPRGSAGGDLRPPERRSALGGRDADRPRRARPGADGDGRQPALLGRDPGPAADDRRAADAGALDGDGPARDRRPAAGRARQPHLRLAERRSPSSPARSG